MFADRQKKMMREYRSLTVLSFLNKFFEPFYQRSGLGKRLNPWARAKDFLGEQAPRSGYLLRAIHVNFIIFDSSSRFCLGAGLHARNSLERSIDR